MGAELQAFTNIPMSKAITLIRNMQGTLQERHATWQRVAMAMGWPYYQFNVELYPEHEEIKTEAKEKRKQEGIEKAKITREKNKKLKESPLQMKHSDAIDVVLDIKIHFLKF